MATKQDVAPRAQRLAALGAVAFLAVATAVAFGRVFRGQAATWKLLAAALVSVALAAALERRSLLLATVVSALALLVTIGLFVFPDTTWLALPTRETLRAAADALGRVGHEARVQVAPSEPLRPLLLAALTAVWTASFSAHALAIRAGSPLLAVLPPVALIGFADTVLDDGARPMYALLLLSAALLVVFSDGLRRIRQWGPVWSSAGRRRLSSVAGRSARRVGVTAVLAALAFPGVLPGFRDDALVDFSTSGGESVQLDPWVSIRSNLTRDTAIPLYRISSIDGLGNRFPSYWRSLSLDLFNGEDWTSSDSSGQRATQLPGTADLGGPVLAPSDAVTRVTQTVQLLRDQEDLRLPMAYPADSVRVPVAQIRYDAELGSVTAPGTLPAASSYTVRSNVVIPTPTGLDTVTPVSPAPKYTFLPASTPDRIFQIADQWAGDAPDPYRQILAIMDHLADSGEFSYDDHVDLSDDSDALLTFLTKTHRGFCQQFAASMAVLVRALGYPARVAVGYRTGTTSGDSYLVTSHDSHAWVEVYFGRFGWLAFEPTPRRPNPLMDAQDSYLDPTTPPVQTGGQDGNTGGGTTPAVQGQTGPSQCVLGGQRLPIRICTDPNQQIAQDRFGGRGRFVDGTGSLFTQPDDGYGVPIRLALSILLLLGLVLLVLVPAVKWVIRLRLAHRHAPPREMVLAAFRLFDGEAADVGLGRHPGETLSEYRRRLGERVRFSDGHLGRLTSTVTRAAYADDEIGPDEARAALHDARIAIRDVRKDVGLVRRLVGVYRPGV